MVNPIVQCITISVVKSWSWLMESIFCGYNSNVQQPVWWYTVIKILSNPHIGYLLKKSACSLDVVKLAWKNLLYRHTLFLLIVTLLQITWVRMFPLHANRTVPMWFHCMCSNSNVVTPLCQAISVDTMSCIVNSKQGII